MKDTQAQEPTNEQLTYERRQELVENIRQAFLRLIDNDEEKEKFDESDIEKVKTFNWTIERHLVNTNWKHDLAFENLIENLQWRKEFGVNQLKEQDFPAEFYRSGSFFDYENDKLGHSVIYIRGRLHKKISDWTPLFKKFFVFIVNKIENDVYFNLDRIDKPSKLNDTNQENVSGNIESNHIDAKQTKAKKKMERKESSKSIINRLDRNDEHNRLNGFSVFWDCEGAGISNVDMDILNFMVKTITTHFPIGLCHVYIYELPWILQAVLSLVRSWIPEYYLNSIVLVKKNDLDNYFELNNLPAYLDGKCERKYTAVPKNCLNAEQIGALNGISSSNVKKLQKHVDSHCKS